MKRLTQLIIGGIILSLAIGLIFFSGGVANNSGHTDTRTTDVATTDTAITTTNTGGRALQRADIGVKVKRIYPPVSGSNKTTMRILLDIRVRGHGSIQYDNIQLCAYDASGRVLKRKPVGNITTDPSGKYYNNQRKNITVQKVPQYITIDHPHLRNDSRFEVEVLDKREDELFYDVTYQGLGKIQNRFEWPRSNQTGTCG